MKKRKIGLMGGTFDPIHNAHIALGEYALKALKLDELWFLPAGNPYMDKKQAVITDARIRVEMVELALSSHDKMRVNTIELEREGNTYTVDTLRILKESYPEDHFIFLIGTDQLFALERWKEVDTLLSLCEIAVARRGADQTEGDFFKQVAYLKEKYACEIHVLDFPVMEISSTEIRARVKSGEDVSSMIPKALLSYISEHRLYQSEGETDLERSL